jgi:hypothetical protein
MKRLIIFCLGLLSSAMLLAQSPSAFNYQAVVQDASALRCTVEEGFRTHIQSAGNGGKA